MISNELSLQIGNTFVLLFAGHETSAHTLAATLGFLALYQTEQQKVYDQILAVVGKNGEPVRTISPNSLFSLSTFHVSLTFSLRQTFEDFNALDRVSAAFHEALRMFRTFAFSLIRYATLTLSSAAGSLMIRQATEDVVLNLPTTTGGVRQTSLPKGATIVADVVGLG